MTRTVYLDGESVSIDQHTTGKELKDIAGAPEDAAIVTHDNGETTTIQDDDLVAEKVRDGAELIVEDPNEFDFGEPGNGSTPTQSDDGDEVDDGFSVILNNEPYPVAPGMTAGELKADIGADQDDITVFANPETGEDVSLHDGAVLEDHVPDGARVSYQPMPREDGNLYGR